MTSKPVYRILTNDEWRIARKRGFISATQADRKDGFIHLSSHETFLETAGRYYSPKDHPWVVELVPEKLMGEIRWELVGARKALFPHFYGGEIPLMAVRAVARLYWGASGVCVQSWSSVQ